MENVFEKSDQVSYSCKAEIHGNSIVYRNHRMYGGSPPLSCWLWWQSTIWKLSEMVDYHHIQVLIWWKVIIWCRSTIFFYVIARAMACQPVRVQTGECKDLIWIWWIFDGYAPYLFRLLFILVHVHIPMMIILCFTEQQ